MNNVEARIAMQEQLNICTSEGMEGVIVSLRSCGHVGHAPYAVVRMEMSEDVEHWPVADLELHADNDAATLAMLGMK